jgi:dTDP-4-amino-4,6-dideoxygalactose transaminase
MNRIPIGDFPLGPEEKAALQRVIDSGRLTMGREVRAFEEEFAAYMGARHCVATSSGAGGCWFFLVPPSSVVRARVVNALGLREIPFQIAEKGVETWDI